MHREGVLAASNPIPAPRFACFLPRAHARTRLLACLLASLLPCLALCPINHQLVLLDSCCFSVADNYLPARPKPCPLPHAVSQTWRGGQLHLFGQGYGLFCQK